MPPSPRRGGRRHAPADITNVSLSDPRSNSTQVLDEVASAVPTDRLPAPDTGFGPMWPAVGMVFHAAAVAALLVLAIASTFNTLRQSYVIRDRSGFTLDSRYIIELDVRSRALQWRDRGELQREFLGDIGRMSLAFAQYGTPPDLKHVVEESKRLIDPEKFSDFGVVNYFTKDYWWPKGISGLYRPLTSITYWWNFAPIRAVPQKKWEEMYREDPEQYYQIHSSALLRFHWTNTILHGVASVLTYFLMLALCRRPWPSAFAAALFAVHPITCESVANIIGRADIFAAIAVFASVLTYVRSTRVSGPARIPWLAATMLIGTLGVFAKESALAFVPACVVYEVVYRYHPRIAGLFQVGRRWFDDATRWVGDFVSACLRFAFTGWVWLIPPVIAVFYVRHLVFEASTPPEEPFLDNPIRGHPRWGLDENPVVSFIEQRMTALQVIGNLLVKLVAPVNLSSDYSYNQVRTFDVSMTSASDWWSVLAALIVAGFLVFAFWLWFRERRAPAYCIFFFFFAMLPTANLVKVIGSIQAERFMYLPLFGFAGGVSLAVFAAGNRLRRWMGRRQTRVPPAVAWAPHAVLSLVVIVFAVRTYQRNWAWRSDEHLWEAALKVSPDAFRAYQSYAFALYENAQIDNVRKEAPLRKAQKARAEAVAVANDPAVGEAERAEAARKAAAAEAEMARAEQDLKPWRDQYKQILQRMIEVDEKGLLIVDDLPPEMNSARLYLHLGMYYGEMGRIHLPPPDAQGNQPLTPEARKWYEKSVAILKRAVPIDRAFNKLNRRKEMTRWRQEWEIGDAGLAPVYLFLGEAQLRLGQWDDAADSYLYVQRLDPVTSTTYLQMGLIRLNQSRVNEALIYFIQAIILDPAREEAWPALINIYRALGVPEAVTVRGSLRQVNAGVPMVRQHVRDAMRELVRTQLRGKQLDLARTLRKQAIDVHGSPAAIFDSLFDDAGVPIEPPPEAEHFRWPQPPKEPGAAVQAASR